MKFDDHRLSQITNVTALPQTKAITTGGPLARGTNDGTPKPETGVRYKDRFAIGSDRTTAPVGYGYKNSIFFPLDFLRNTDLVAVAAAIAQYRAFYGSAVEIGGKFHRISAVTLSERDWQRHFQPEFGLLRSAKSRFDSGDVLTPGIEFVY